MADYSTDETPKVPYVTDRELEIAAEVAFDLGQPLLLTGEPGTGKTTFADHVAEVLAPSWLSRNAPPNGGEAPVVPALPLYSFVTKSLSAATDLFYRFDNLRRFHAAHDTSGEMSRENIDYISFEALGRAILLTHPRSEVDDLLRSKADAAGPQRSVVLIDEIDKAPRDFPNDILMEIDRMSFEIPELQTKDKRVRVVKADKRFKPIVVLTSNSEKNLPAAFLRRCVFHHIRFPERNRRSHLEKVVKANLVHTEGKLVDDAIEVFYRIREQPEQEKKPATAELVRWILALQGRALRAQLGPDARLADLKYDDLAATLGVLVKSADDKSRVDTIVRGFVGRA